MGDKKPAKEARKIINRAELYIEISNYEQKNIIRCGESSLSITAESLLTSPKKYTHMLELEYSRIDDIKVDRNFGDNCKMEVYFEGSKFMLIADKDDADYLDAVRHLLLPGIRAKKKK